MSVVPQNLNSFVCTLMCYCLLLVQSRFSLKINEVFNQIAQLFLMQNYFAKVLGVPFLKRLMTKRREKKSNFLFLFFLGSNQHNQE